MDEVTTYRDLFSTGISYLLVLSGFTLVATLLLRRLARLARKKGEHPRTWQLYALLGWGFLWVGERLLAGWLPRALPALGGYRWVPVVLMLAGCAGIYLLLRDRLFRKTDDSDWKSKVDQIGKTPPASKEH